MKRLRSLVPAIALAITTLTATTAARATVYVLEVEARVSRVAYYSRSLPDDINYTGPGLFHVGDTMHLAATFDTDAAIRTGFLLPDQRTYAVPGAATLTVGSYVSSFSASELLLYNDRVIATRPPVDRQSFAFTNDPVTAPPFGHADGIRRTETLTFIGLDDSTTALDGLSLADLASGGFNTLLLNYILPIYSGANGEPVEGYFAATDGVSFRLIAIPEPTGWAMMVSGFGLLGATLRRRAARARTD